MEQLLLTLLGGALTLAGGFGGILYVRHLADEDAKKTFNAAVLIVLDELGANEVNIENLVDKPFGQPELYDSTYRSVELVLASRLQPADRQILAEAYAPLRARWAAEAPTESPTTRVGLKAAGMIVPTKERLTAALEKIKAARAALAAYLSSGRS